jgi:hypothetical protein
MLIFQLFTCSFDLQFKPESWQDYTFSFLSTTNTQHRLVMQKIELDIPN